jgi:hypothetical protein
MLHPAWKLRLTIILLLAGLLVLWRLGDTVAGVIVGIICLAGCMASGLAAFQSAWRGKT